MHKNVALKAFCLAALAFSLTPVAQAQFDASYVISNPTNDPGNEVKQQEAKVGVSAPVYANPQQGYVITLGASAQDTRWDFDDSQLPSVDLLKVKLPVSVMFKAGERTVVTAGLTPGFHGKRSDMGNSDFRVEGQMFAAYIHSANVQWIGGVGYADSFGKTKLFPIMGAIYHPSEELTINAVVPQLQANYKVNSKWSLKTEATAAGGEWVWSFDGSNPNIGQGDVNAELQAYRLGVGAEYRVTKGLAIYGTGGRELGRKITFTNSNDHSRKAKLDLSDANYLMIGFKFE